MEVFMNFIQILVRLAVESARLMPAGSIFHVRDLFPPAFWFALPISVRMQIGRRLYDATLANFWGFDPEHVAVYN
jgi:hypothetical protein